MSSAAMHLYPTALVGIRRASAEVSSAHSQALGRVATLRERRRAVAAVDELVSALEEINLSGRGRKETALMPGWLRRLEVDAGRPLPSSVSAARTPVKLHAALLDWQEKLLDDAVPGRGVFARLDHQLWAQEGVSWLPETPQSSSGVA